MDKLEQVQFEIEQLIFQTEQDIDLDEENDSMYAYKDGLEDALQCVLDIGEQE